MTPVNPASGKSTAARNDLIKGSFFAESEQRILVVDDNSDAANSLAILMTLTGNSVRICSDGARAITEARHFMPDAILLDIGLPDIDGYEVARQIREIPGLEHTLMIAITGYGYLDDRCRSKSAGIDYHLVKPVDIETLLQLLVPTQRNR